MLTLSRPDEGLAIFLTVQADATSGIIRSLRGLLRPFSDVDAPPCRDNLGVLEIPGVDFGNIGFVHSIFKIPVFRTQIEPAHVSKTCISMISAVIPLGSGIIDTAVVTL
jgi:hypothetical protein